MSDTVVGGLLALVGVIVGGLISFLTEVWRSNKFVSERKYQRRKEIADKRCDEAEKFVRAMTDDLQSNMYNAKLLLMDDETLAKNRLSKLINNAINKKDFGVFSLGASILALSDNNLIEVHSSMLKSLEELKAITRTVVEAKVVNRQIDVHKTANQIDMIWEKYSRNLGKFYKHIDIIRYNLSEENTKT